MGQRLTGGIGVGRGRLAILVVTMAMAISTGCGSTDGGDQSGDSVSSDSGNGGSQIEASTAQQIDLSGEPPEPLLFEYDTGVR